MLACLALPCKLLFVSADSGNSRIASLDLTSNALTTFASGIIQPQGVAVNMSDGSVFVAEPGLQTVRGGSRSGATPSADELL
jgi:hypothetical protein